MTEKENNVFRLNSECIKCLLKKYLSDPPAGIDEITKTDYFRRVLGIIANADNSVSAPEIVAMVTRLQKEMFGKFDDYTELKKHFNALMDGYGERLTKNIAASDDGLRLAVCYSLLGNYIDFGAMDSVDENKLDKMIADASALEFDETELSNLKNDLKNAEKLVFITDNCGEIALDKLLMKKLLTDYPSLNLKIIVRGAPVLNDATLDDARQIGLDGVAPVYSNGSDVAGTCLGSISAEAKEIIEQANVIIAKGHGNFETLQYCGKNVYYLFLCKCLLFAERYNVPRFTPMLLNDLRMD